MSSSLYIVKCAFMGISENFPSFSWSWRRTKMPRRPRRRGQKKIKLKPKKTHINTNVMPEEVRNRWDKTKTLKEVWFAANNSPDFLPFYLLQGAHSSLIEFQSVGLEIESKRTGFCRSGARWCVYSPSICFFNLLESSVPTILLRIYHSISRYRVDSTRACTASGEAANEDRGWILSSARSQVWHRLYGMSYVFHPQQITRPDEIDNFTLLIEWLFGGVHNVNINILMLRRWQGILNLIRGKRHPSS